MASSVLGYALYRSALAIEARDTAMRSSVAHTRRPLSGAETWRAALTLVNASVPAALRCARCVPASSSLRALYVHYLGACLFDMVGLCRVARVAQMHSQQPPQMHEATSGPSPTIRQKITCATTLQEELRLALPGMRCENQRAVSMTVLGRPAQRNAATLIDPITQVTIRSFVEEHME